MTITYVAQTQDHLLMLDSDGVCLFVHRRGRAGGHPDDVPASEEAANRCIGAQYVAALDARAVGLLAHDPVVGAPMLFAKVNESGRISVVRTEPIERFEVRGSGVYESGSAAPGRDREKTPIIAFLPDDCVEEDDDTKFFRRAAKASAAKGRATRLRVG